MTDVQVQNSGRYVCRCLSNDGEIHTSEYELNIEDQHKPKNNPKKPKIEYAEVGSNVKLRCHTDHHPTMYLWTRPDGVLPRGQDYTHVRLTIISLLIRIRELTKNYLNISRVNYNYRMFVLVTLAPIFVQRHTVVKQLI